MTKPPGPTLGHQIRTLRENIGWTQSELAAHVEQQVQAELEELGLSQLADQFRYEETAISHWEHDRSLPTTSELIALAKVLGCRAVIVRILRKEMYDCAPYTRSITNFDQAVHKAYRLRESPSSQP